MLGQNILTILITLQGALSYYFYNPATHQVLPIQSLDNVPKGYKILPPPKQRKRRPQEVQTNNGVCIDAGFTCNTPFERSLTYQYECDADFQCPRQYKCCPQKCFLHKICSKAEVKLGSPSDRSSVNGRCGRKSCGQTQDRPGTCEKWPYNCPKPYDYSLTSAFKCERDRQCPRSFKCCQQSCFLHKICSRVIPTNVTPQKVITSINKVDQQVPAEILSPKKTTTQEATTEETTTEETTTEESTTEETTTEETTTEETTTEETTKAETTTEETSTVKTTTVKTTAEETTTPAMKTVTEGAFTKEEENGEDEEIEEDEDEGGDVEPTEGEKITPIPNFKEKSTPDANAIIPEYADYYYHYGTGNNSTTDDDYEEEEEEEDDDDYKE